MKSANDRFKRYEASYNYLLPPRTYTIVRVDGRGFSKFTKRMNKPFDEDFSEAMNYAAIQLCKEFNPEFAFTQSDEISLVFTDFGIDAQQMFGGKIQKLCSLTASCAATNFNKKLTMLNAEKEDDVTDLCKSIIDGSILVNSDFDSRVFTIPDYVEVGNYFVWRQQDATRNSVSMAADALYSHKELIGKSSSDKQEMLFIKGVNWNDYAVKYKRGVIIFKEQYKKDVSLEHNDNVYGIPYGGIVTRSRWVVNNETPIFTVDKGYLMALIPSTFDDK